MLSSKCTHLRIRDNNDYVTNVDDLIKTIEKEYNIDFRSLPNWKELVQRLHVAKTDCKRKIQDARLRKSMIIDKLYIQSTRPSPFELSIGLCRTAAKWRQIETKVKKRNIPAKLELHRISSTQLPDKLVEPFESPHPNTEVPPSEAPESESEPSKLTVGVQAGSPTETSCLPVLILKNLHKRVSPLGSHLCALSYKSLSTITDEVTVDEKDDWLNLKPATNVVCTPTLIVLTDNTLKQQTVQFSVINYGCKYLYIRFKRVLDDTHFLTAKVLPVIPKRLCPGIPVVYKFIFRLRNEEEFKSDLYFKVGRDGYDETPPEAFRIPIISAFTLSRSVSVTDVVTIPPVYPWHIKRNNMYRTTTVNVTINDSHYYHLHIYKRLVDIFQRSDILPSLKAFGPDSVSMEQRNVDNEVDDKIISSSANIQNLQVESDSIDITESIALISKDIIELALDAFIFEHTYLYLPPHSKVKIPVYFTKAEHIGYHQSYYDFEFVDPVTEQVVFKEPVKIFAEVLPHPIQIQPLILDMSLSPVSHGICKDFFIVRNSHKLYAVTVKIKLTTKMRKVFYVEPMEVSVPAMSSVSFTVKFCSRDFLSDKPSEDLVHFTFKIIVSGYKTVYENVPPIFYEVIAPCAEEFKKVYNEKYFRED